MRPLTRWIVSVFASPAGIVVLGALDSTLFFNLPLGIDAVVIILAARMRGLAWVVPLLATAGSVAGAWLTFWMGTKAGDAGLDRYMAAKRLDSIRARIHRSGAVALAVLDLIPPPFPFTLFVLAAGALEVEPRTFFVTLTACRVLRFGLEAALAALYGRSILAWLDSDIFHDFVAFFTVLALVLTTISIVKLVRATRSAGKRRAAA